MTTKHSSRFWSAAVLMLTGAVFAAGQPTRSGGANLHLSAPARAHQKASNKRYAAQDKILEAARDDAAAGRYAAAIEKYSSVLAELELETSSVKSWIADSRRREVEGELRRLREFWGNRKLAEAKGKFLASEYGEAIQLAQEAIQADSNKKQEANQLINACRGEQRNKERIAEVQVEKFAPNVPDYQKKIEVLLKQAKVFYQAKRYDDALACVEKVYKLNPFQPEATSLANQIYQQYYTYGYHRHRADSESMLAFAEWQWIEPVFGRMEQQKPVDVGMKRADSAATDQTASKLDRIIFPRIDFEQTDFPAALEVLNRNKDYDTSESGGGIRINSNFGAGAEGTSKLVLTLKMQNVSLRDLLDYICLMTGLKYAIRANDVLIGFEGQVNDLTQESFKVHPQLLRMISRDSEAIGGEAAGEEGGKGGAGAGAAGKTSAASSAKSEGGGGGGGTFSTEENSSDGGVTAPTAPKKIVLMEANLKPFFSRYGVKFPPKSSISYNKNSGHLVLRNTRENIWLMKEIMREFDALQQCMVLVEIKSITIGETDYQALGFYWALGDLGSNMNSNGVRTDSSKTGWYAGVGSAAKYDASTNIAGSYSMLRNSVNNAGQLINNLELFPTLLGSVNPFGSDYQLNLSLSVNALDQSNRSEAMAAPKVLTNSGEQAQVKMTTSYYFPESWDSMEFSSESNETSTYFSVTPPIPDFGDAEEMGTIFNVTPTIQGDNKTIRLNINMTNATWTSKDEYTVGVTGNTFELNTTTGKKDKVPFSYLFKIWRPVIARQVMEMQVDVYDGETLILGGMVKNESSSQVDKIPFLGDLPLIGRFFQSHSENRTNTNMLLFVTARRVGNDGIPLQGDAAGSPDFKR